MGSSFPRNLYCSYTVGVSKFYVVWRQNVTLKGSCVVLINRGFTIECFFWSVKTVAYFVFHTLTFSYTSVYNFKIISYISFLTRQKCYVKCIKFILLNYFIWKTCEEGKRPDLIRCPLAPDWKRNMHSIINQRERGC